MEDASSHNGETMKELKAQLGQAKNSIQELGDTITRPNVRVIKVPEGAEREIGLKNVFNKITKELFP